ncbi:DUF4142 domain-containing protein [Achromobacter dolens]|uniref:DUF4142 domain-containing protein n=1 Tax=Achromobacter dolens TaxID=1287738 RepID=UPI0011A04D30|nr:DUF4142 domain-containing protein [Achromobacter dolens]
MNQRTLWQGLVAACLFSLLAAPLAARAAAVSRADSHFLQAAAAADAFQVEAAKLAGERAGSTEVHTFAAKMQARYAELDRELRQLADDRKVALPGKAEPSDQRTLEALAGKTGPAFDALYVEQVALQAHEKAEKLYRAAAGQGGDAKIREFAARHVSTLGDHLALARALKRDPAANPERMPPATPGEPPPVSPAERAAPASVTPGK